MAELPDINTAEVGLIAYWNALDHGASSVDPTEVLKDGMVRSFESYDNGLDMTVSMGRNQGSSDANLRVKTDGWFVCWLPPDENIATRDTGTYGLFDIIPEWDNIGSGPKGLSNHMLLDRIKRGAESLSNWSNITWSNSDVGLYSYEYSNATKITVMGDKGKPTRSEISYSSSTNRHYHVAVGITGDPPNTNSKINFTGKTLSSWSGKPGSMDVIGGGHMPKAGTFYSHGGFSGEYGGQPGKVQHLILHS